VTTLVTKQIENDENYDQKIRVYKTMQLKNVRLHVYKQGTLTDGVLTLSILDGTTQIASKTVDYSLLNAITTNNYWHGFISFEFDDAVFLSTNPTDVYNEYTLRFTMSDHTDDSDIYVDIYRDYERWVSNSLSDFKYVPMYGTETTDGITAEHGDEYPLGIEIYKLN